MVRHWCAAARRAAAGAGERRSTASARSSTGSWPSWWASRSSRSAPGWCCVLIPLLIGMMWAIRQHYRRVEAALACRWTDTPVCRRRQPRVIVPVSRLDRADASRRSPSRARISTDVTAVHVADEDGGIEEMQRRWGEWGGPVRLIILESPYRALLAPLLAYIDATESADPRSRRPSSWRSSCRVTSGSTRCTTRRRCASSCGSSSARNTVVVDVPFHLRPPRTRHPAKAA